MNCAINLRQHITLEDSLGENSFPEKADAQFVGRILKDRGWSLSHVCVRSSCDAHLCSGLGSSAAAAVALIAAIQRTAPLSPFQLAEEAWQAEQAMGWFGGKQDQYAAAYGGVNVMEFHGSEGVNVVPLARSTTQTLEDALVLVYTGEREKKHPQKKLQEPTKKQIAALHEVKHIALGAMEFVAQGNWQKVGEALEYAWEFKKKCNPVMTNTRLDMIHDLGRGFGAVGGKLLGAGSGGYMVFVVDPQRKQEFIKQMKFDLPECEYPDFSFDYQGAEARIL